MLARVLLLAALAALPMAGLLVSVQAGAELELRWQTLLGEAGERLGDALPALDYLCARDAGLADSAVCRRAAQVEQLGLLASAALLLAVLLPLAMLGWSLLASLWRPLLSLARPLCWLWLLWLALQIAADVAVATLAAQVAETVLFGRPRPLVGPLLGLAGGCLLLLVLLPGFGLLRRRPLFLLAEPVRDDAHPRLAALLGEVAERLDAPLPEHLLLGLEPGVHVIAEPLELHPSERVLGPRALYLSLPLMRVLDGDQLAALLAHELAHWQAGERHHSRHGAPALSVLARALARRRRGAAGLRSWPAAALLELHLQLAKDALRRHAYLRETLADEVAAAVAGPRVLAAALLRLAVADVEWRSQDSDLLRALAEERRAKNLSRVFQKRLGLLEEQDRVEMLAEHRTPHPCDEHPPLLDRLERLSLSAARAAGVSMAPPAAPAIDLLEKAERIEEALSDAQQFLYLARGYAPEAQP